MKVLYRQSDTECEAGQPQIRVLADHLGGVARALPCRGW